VSTDIDSTLSVGQFFENFPVLLIFQNQRIVNSTSLKKNSESKNLSVPIISKTSKN
jgi:hypothetical protein